MNSEMLLGGRVLPHPEDRPKTGTWRGEQAPKADLARCVNCLLCWAYCPDAAIQVADATFVGVDWDLCKGCEICVAVCPMQALSMVSTRDTMEVG